MRDRVTTGLVKTSVLFYALLHAQGLGPEILRNGGFLRNVTSVEVLNFTPSLTFGPSLAL